MKMASFYKAFGSVMLVAGLTSAAQAAQYWEGSSAPAAVAFPTPNTDIAASPLSDRFSGIASLGRTCFFIPITLGCTLELDGEIRESGSNIVLDISAGQSLGPTTGGGGLLQCGDVSFSNFTSGWTATTAQTNLPVNALDTTAVNFTVTGVVVDTICGSCSGSIGAQYRNVNRGEFDFSGSIGACNVSGTLDSAPTPSSTGGSSQYYRVWQ